MGKIKEIDLSKVVVEDYYSPVADYILLAYKEIHKSAGGVILPDAVVEQESRKNRAMKVIACGSDVRNITASTKGNDVYVFLAQGVTAPILELLGQKYVQVREMDIYGTVSADYLQVDELIRQSKEAVKA